MSQDKHTAEAQAGQPQTHAVVAPLERGVGPVAEIVNGSLRWHIPRPNYTVNVNYLRMAHMLYDRAALDAAVAAERERCAKLCDEQAAQWNGRAWAQKRDAAARCAAALRA